MIKRLLKTILLTSVVYALPLIGAPELIINIKILIAALGCVILLLSQPDIKPSEAKANRTQDKWTMLSIIGVCGICQIAPVIDFGYFSSSAVDEGTTAWTIIGLLMITGGIAFRIWSIKTLGKFFTATVQIVEGQKIIKSGPYTIVRHPSYTGAFFAMVGTALFLGSVIGTIISIILMLSIYHFRITTEEETLINEFGDAYKSYQSSTKKLIPLIY